MRNALSIKCIVHKKIIKVKEHMKGIVLEDYVANNLSRLFSGLKLVSRHKRITDRRTIDIYAKDARGGEYYIEVKRTDCNRLNIGQAVEYKSQLAKVNPNAKMILICRSADAPIKETLSKMGIEIRTFADLEIPKEIIDYEPSKPLLLNLSPTEQRSYFALLRRGVTIARAEDLSSAIGVSKSWAKNILSKLAKRGAAHRVGRGKYAIIPADVIYGRKSYVADPLVLVSELMKDCEYYVAYQSAAHVHGIVEQVPFRTTVTVLKQKRPVKVGNTQIDFVTLKESKFFGFKEVKYSNVYLKVSDLEKTIIDCIDRQDLCGGITEVARTLSNAVATEKLNGEKLVSYVRRFKSYALAQRLGFVLEHLGKVGEIQVEPTILDDLWRLAGSCTYPLDIKASKKGKVSKRWKIIENTQLFKV